MGVYKDPCRMSGGIGVWVCMHAHAHGREWGGVWTCSLPAGAQDEDTRSPCYHRSLLHLLSTPHSARHPGSQSFLLDPSVRAASQSACKLPLPLLDSSPLSHSLPELRLPVCSVGIITGLWAARHLIPQRAKHTVHEPSTPTNHHPWQLPSHVRFFRSAGYERSIAL